MNNSTDRDSENSFAGVNVNFVPVNTMSDLTEFDRPRQAFKDSGWYLQWESGESGSIGLDGPYFGRKQIEGAISQGNVYHNSFGISCNKVTLTYISPAVEADLYIAKKKSLADKTH